MNTICQVCKTQVKETDKKCPTCGFTELIKPVINEEDGEYWMKTAVEPYRQNGSFQKKKPS